MVVTTESTLLGNLTSFKEVQSSQKDSISETKEKSKLVKSILIIFLNPLNIFLQEVKLVSHANLIVFGLEVNSSILFIFSVISSLLFIWMLVGNGVNPSFNIDCSPSPSNVKIMEFVEDNFLNSAFCVVTNCEKREMIMINKRMNIFILCVLFLLVNLEKN